MSHDQSSSSPKTVLVAVAVVLAIYAITAVQGYPQKGTEMIVAGQAHGAGDHGEHDDHDANDEHAAGGKKPAAVVPDYYAVVPFVLLLGAIVVLPLLRATEHWWESNVNRFLVAVVLAAVTLLYYVFVFQGPVESHWPAHSVVVPVDGGGQWQIAWTVFANAMLHEYIPFIMLLFSLYTISGGIRISGDLRAHPLTNTIFIAIGGALASFIGTTGAAMLLIRPLLETNAERKRVTHTVVFFIFVVCNCGGCLLPIGDPPLFLGYLRGVDFMWTFTALWQEWLFVNCMLIGVYFLVDHFVCYRHESIRDVQRDETEVRPFRITGLWVNAPLLFGVILAVAFLDPSKAIPGTDWHPWLYLREIVQLALVGLSLLLGSQTVREQNKFNYHAIVEVAALFCGIFICMQPALQILNEKGDELGVNSSQAFFWATGGLSAVLDNAPTYVVFFETAKNPDLHKAGMTMVPLPLGQQIPETYLIAISLGAVFMGAMTYIGNGPNFMVRAIAESSGVRMPSFFGYMIYSCVILLPILVLATLIFLP
jgi:Na+/H+ antiporter NhaD/arsenite permease-like protein